ncbi:MAG: hypothetical protein QXJ68_02125 [Methanocellales archaeon]
MRQRKSRVKKEVIQPEKIELLIPGAEFERTCTEDLILAFKDLPDELRPRKKCRKKRG